MVFSPSRGTTIITQKENKGEYHGIHCRPATTCDGGYINNGTIWYWNNSSYDWDIYAHVFDQNGKNGTTNNIPIRYANNSTNYYNTNNIPQCSDYDDPTALLEKAKGLYGNNYQKIVKDQYSCKPNTLNAGNWYNFPAATAGSNNASTSTEKNMPNSICPKGWQLPPNSGNKSYNTLIRTAYGLTATNSDSTLLNNSTMSFVRLGYYRYDYGSLNGRGDHGNYWSSTAYSSVLSHYLNFLSGNLNPQHGTNRAIGYSIRCVSR